MDRLHRTAFLVLLTAFAVLALSACGGSSPAENVTGLESATNTLAKTGPTPKDEEFLPHLKAGYFTICKVAEGSTDLFGFDTVAEGPGVASAPLYVYQAPSGPDIDPDHVTITEDLTAGYQVDRVFIWSLDADGEGGFVTTWHELPAGTVMVEGEIDANKIGCVVIFYNSKIPETGEGTGTPGYWKNHPDAWPVEEITIGGTTYSKDDAIGYMSTPERGDKSFTLFRALVCAELNVMIGNESGCVDDTISDADDWMADHPVGSGVRGSSDAWKVGEPLYTTLDDYNNGLLCAPHRD
jgi:hypothetical protein